MMLISTMGTVRRVLLLRTVIAAVALGGVTAAMVVPAPAETPSQWVRAFWPQAREAGISRAVYDRALGSFRPDPEVLEKARSQAEFSKPIWDYLDLTVTDHRIVNGRTLSSQHARLLSRLEARYGVDRHILVAIWGMESSYGAVLDNPQRVKSTIRSLATLAYDGGSRARFGRQQLIAALKILQRGDIPLSGMTGSWAGAMGHTQFIPTTYEGYAVDHDGDGRRDVWNSPADALASAANYLDKMGWEPGKTWGYEVSLPRGFDLGHAKRARSLGAWQKLGVRRVGGAGFPRPRDEATLLAPAGRGGPAFLMVKNFRVLKRYNNADAYALAVGHLADRLKGFGPFQGRWPESAMLDQSMRAELQRLLAARGFYAGEIDANLGSGSQAAIRAYQASIGAEVNGEPSMRLLQQLRAGG